jgi:hypothetical protein
MTKSNPLAKYFRVPGVHVTLPSGGRFGDHFPEEVTINGEIPVFPMTASDEVTIKNPDGLLNGFAVEKLIKSCVPSIQNVRDLPTQDTDALLLAIKLCSYGDTLEVSAKCPVCGHDNAFGVSIRDILGRMTMMEEEYPVRLNDDMVAYLRPYDFEASTKLNLAAFEETKLIQNLVAGGLDEMQRITQFNQSFEKISGINLDLLSNCVEYIQLPDSRVDDQDDIREFILSTDNATVAKIRKAMEAFDKTGVNKEVSVVCEGVIKGVDGKEDKPCGHEWTTEFAFDPSHFFE